MIPAEKHILLAWGRDYDDVSPVKGVILGGGRHSLRVAVDVERVDEGDGEPAPIGL
jgi:transglutaminase-like putative cysteine protease